jgi:hypothetical protein
MIRMDMLRRYQFYGVTDASVSLKSLWFNHVRFSLHARAARTDDIYIPAEEAMATIYRAAYVSLHVRKSNRAAIGLYRDTLGFDVYEIEKKYCKRSLQGSGPF